MLALIPLAVALAASSSTTFSQETVLATGTADATWYWITAQGEPSGIQAPFRQPFTRYFSEIHSPLSGKIGLGHIPGEAGHSRQYPLTTGVDPSKAYATATSGSASSKPTFRVLRQALDTDSRGLLKSESAPWTSIAAMAGDASTWYGPSISQPSQDTQVGTKSTTGVYGGTYTFLVLTIGSHEATGTVDVTPEGSPFKTATVLIKTGATGIVTSTIGEGATISATDKPTTTGAATT